MEKKKSQNPNNSNFKNVQSTQRSSIVFYINYIKRFVVCFKPKQKKKIIPKNKVFLPSSSFFETGTGSEVRKPSRLKKINLLNFFTAKTVNVVYKRISVKISKSPLLTSLFLWCVLCRGCCTKAVTIYKLGVCPVNVFGCLQKIRCFFQKFNCQIFMKQYISWLTFT